MVEPKEDLLKEMKEIATQGDEALLDQAMVKHHPALIYKLAKDMGMDQNGIGSRARTSVQKWISAQLLPATAAKAAGKGRGHKGTAGAKGEQPAGSTTDAPPPAPKIPDGIAPPVASATPYPLGPSEGKGEGQGGWEKITEMRTAQETKFAEIQAVLRGLSQTSASMESRLNRVLEVNEQLLGLLLAQCHHSGVVADEDGWTKAAVEMAADIVAALRP